MRADICVKGEALYFPTNGYSVIFKSIMEGMGRRCIQWTENIPYIVSDFSLTPLDCVFFFTKDIAFGMKSNQNYEK